MRKSTTAALLAASLAAASVMAGQSAQAEPRHGPTPVADRNWHGNRYCWYDKAWHGAGWYQCGSAGRKGHGWGGARGWNGWR